MVLVCDRRDVSSVVTVSTTPCCYAIRGTINSVSYCGGSFCSHMEVMTTMKEVIMIVLITE